MRSYNIYLKTEKSVLDKYSRRDIVRALNVYLGPECYGNVWSISKERAVIIVDESIIQTKYEGNEKDFLETLINKFGFIEWAEKQKI